MEKILDLCAINIGLRIRLFRRLAQITEATLASNLGVTPAQIKKYESGTSRISAMRLQEIAIELNAPISVFFDWIPANNSSNDHERTQNLSALISELLDCDRSIELLQAFRRVKDHHARNTIINIVKKFADEG